MATIQSLKNQLEEIRFKLVDEERFETVEENIITARAEMEELFQGTSDKSQAPWGELVEILNDFEDSLRVDDELAMDKLDLLIRRVHELVDTEPYKNQE